MTSSERAVLGVLILAVMAGFIGGVAYPQPNAHVSHLLAWFCLALVAVLALIVLHARRGRP